jgi:hypothetical protein
VLQLLVMVVILHFNANVKLLDRYGSHVARSSSLVRVTLVWPTGGRRLTVVDASEWIVDVAHPNAPVVRRPTNDGVANRLRFRATSMMNSCSGPSNSEAFHVRRQVLTCCCLNKITADSGLNGFPTDQIMVTAG